MDPTLPFEDGAATPSDSAAAFVVDLDGYEGPIDVLLALAREQKVDLTQISILALADQYLAFMNEARRRDLELAADYLVMAAWLAYMKSRLLLPDLNAEDEPSGEEMAAALAYQLRRLEAMRDAGQKLMGRARLGQDFFKRGEPEVFRRQTEAVYEANLFELLRAYGNQKRRRGARGPLHIEPFEIYTVDDALKRLNQFLGTNVNWSSLWKYLPTDLSAGLKTRSAVASMFAASLEMAREGRLRIRQTGPFADIHLRPTTPEERLARERVNDDAALEQTETPET